MKKKHLKHVIRFTRLLLQEFNHALNRKGTLGRKEIAAVLADVCDAYDVPRGVNWEKSNV